MQLDNAAMNWELKAEYRAHLCSQRAALLEILRWAYSEAKVPHPFDEQLGALYGRTERRLRTPQPPAVKEVGQQRPIIRSRRGAGSIA